MKNLHLDEANVKSTFVEDEIGELRKYIVEMMHAEMELMESIKLNERNVTAANARIKHFKELIAQEHHRYKALRKEFEGDANELRDLEEKQIVAEEKHRQFRDAVAQRESEVQILCTQFQHQRTAMLSLRCQISNVTTQLKTLSSMDNSMEEEARNVAAALEKCIEPTPQRAARQKICAKIRHVQQFIAQMDQETRQLVEKRKTIEAEVLNYEQEAHKLRERVFVKEKEAEILFSRLRNDTFRIIQENDKIEGKLKSKRRRFRLKTKNEIRSLKRTISFITSELEKSQMTNEDVLSNIGTLCTKREELEKKLSARNEQVVGAESAIAELSTALATVNRIEGNSNTSPLEEKMARKRIDAETAQQKLEEKQNLLQVLENDLAQLNATLEDIDAQIVGAKDAAKALDVEVISLTKDIGEQEARCGALRTSVTSTEKEYNDLQTQFQVRQRHNKSIAKTQAKLRRQNASLLKNKEEMTAGLREIEDLSKVLAEGIMHGTEYAQQLSGSNPQDQDDKKRIEFELRRQELSLQQQCAQEENNFQAEVAAWDNKIRRVEQELRRIQAPQS